MQIRLAGESVIQRVIPKIQKTGSTFIKKECSAKLSVPMLPAPGDGAGSALGLMSGQLLTRIIHANKVDQGVVVKVGVRIGLGVIVGVNVSVGMSVGNVMSIGPGSGSIGISGQTA